MKHPSCIRGRRWTGAAVVLALWVTGLLMASPSQAATPGHVFNIRAHGAVGDGKALDTAAINEAVTACAAAGGGQVLFPKGRYLSGTVHLKSNVTLNFEAGSRLVGITDLDQYQVFTAQPNAPEGRAGKWHRALILGDGVENIAIIGQGVIDGNKVFDPRGEEKMRGPHTIIVGRCRGVSVRDVTLLDSANYALLIEYCDRVKVSGVTFRGGWDGVHFRGWKDWPCRDLTIQDCRFFTGDDSIAGRYVDNLLIRNCTINTSCNGVRIIGPLRKMTLEKCEFFGPGVNPHRTSPTGRNNMLAGIILQPGAWDPCDGALEDVRIADVTMKNVAAPVVIWLKRPGNSADRIHVSGLKATEVYRAPLSVEGWNGARVGTVEFRDVQIEYSGGGAADQARMNVKSPSTDPRPLPSWGFYARNVERLNLINVGIRFAREDRRPVLEATQVGHLLLDRFQYPTVEGVKKPLVIGEGTHLEQRDGM